MDTWYTVVWELEHGQMSLKRVKEIFGTQGSAPVSKQNNDKVTESGEAEPDKNPPEQADDHESGEKNSKNKNHPGRRSAKDHPEATRHITKSSWSRG